ncbi:serine hydrolase [Rickettsiales bacterium LUAb2]
MYHKKYKSFLLFYIILFLSFILYSKDSFAIPKHTSYVILDYNSGKILSGNNENVRMYPASLTKIMTLYILFEQIDAGKIKLTDKFKVSKKAASMPSSKLWLKAGSYITVKDAINAMIIKSANDAAYVVAENVGKTEPKFVAMMNSKVKQMGLKNTHFVNPNGLTAPREYSTALDMAILSRNLITRFNNYYYLFSQTSFNWNKYTYRSTNHLLKYSNIDGLKTGYTSASGFNLVTSADINGIRVITATLGHPSSSSRDNFTKQLIKQGIIIAQNMRFQSINYKDPPSKIILANNKLGSTNKNISVAELINKHNSSTVSNSNDTNLVSIKNLEADKNKTINSSNLTPVNYTANKVNDNDNNNDDASLKEKLAYYLQLGVFSTSTAAENIAKQALSIEPLLKKSNVTISTISLNNNSNTLYRVRLYGLSRNDASNACKNLQKDHKQNCFISTEIN